MPPQATLFQFGPYRVESILGQGAVATVYGARRQNSGLVALKVLSGAAASHAKIRQGFQREFRLVSRLRHPGIIRMLDIGEVDGRFYIAMDLVDGETLEELLMRRKTLGEVPAIDIVRQVAETLDYIHSQGVVHRDIKTSNIMLSRTGRALLFDFGAALNINDYLPEEIEGVFGTPAFLAPEQARGNGLVDGRADIYALGIVLYRAVSGRKPFYGAREEMLEAHQHETPPKPSEFAYVSPGLERIVLKAIEKDPNGRFQTGAEMVHALQHVELMPEPERPELSQRVLQWLRERVNQ